MQRVSKREYGSRRPWKMASSISALLLAFVFGGCSSSTVSSSTKAQNSPQKYLAVAGGGNDTNTFIIDDAGDAFTQETFAVNSRQQGAQISNAGGFTALQRGLLSLEVTASYTFNSLTNNWTVTTPPATPGFAIELAGQAGGLEQLPGQPAAILVPTTAQCPSIKTAQTYQFISIPSALIQPGAPVGLYTWDPVTDTAFGTVEISTSGSTVNFKNIKQFTLSGAQSNPTPVTGVCGQTAYGNAISIPGQITVTNPGNGGSNPPQAIVAIGSTGLLVEDNGMINSGSSAGTYMNALGAGTGAVGLPKPSTSSPLNTSDLVGAQYLGFIYGAGAFVNDSSPTGWSSHLASFGFSTLPTSCPSVSASTSPATVIYGGDFPVNLKTGLPDPGPGNSNNPNYPYGNCDFAIDLGSPQDSSNSLYPNAKVWVGTHYAGYTASSTNPFSGVAIAGQLNGKFAVFVIGSDNTQPWAIYLLQSN